MTRAGNISRIPRIAGFTLIELLVTLAIAAILATMAAPMLSGFLARSQMNAVANEYTGALQMARMEAVSRNLCVSVCRRASSGAAQCAGADGPWTSGWLVYDNPTCTGTAAVTDPPSGTSLRAQEALPASISMNKEGGGNALGVVVFTPRGVLLQGPSMGGTMQIADARVTDGSMDRFFKLAATGQLREAKKGEK